MYLQYQKMQRHKTPANRPETSQHEENCYKVDGYKSIRYRKHCSTIIQSVGKFVLPTIVDNCFKLLSKCPNCTLQALTLFVAQISTRLLLYLILFNSEWNETTGLYYKLVMKHTQCLMLPHVTPTMNATTSCYCIFSSAFSEKKNTCQRPIKNPCYKLLFRFFWVDLTGLQSSIATICFCTNVTEDYKINRFQRVYSGPQGLAFCSGNSDRDYKMI